MTKHEIYIDGALIDLGDDFDIALLYQSWFFQEITNITSNRSYTVKVPPTPCNLRAIGFSSYEDVVSDYPYKKHTVDYYRNGFQLIKKGLAIITSIDANINFTFTWGSIQNFSLLSDDSLRDLDDGSYYNWNTSSAILSTAENFGQYKIDFGKGFDDPEYINPSVRAKYIFDRIKAKYGITLDFLAADKYLVPLLTMNGGECNRKESLCEFHQGQPGYHTYEKTYMIIGGNPNPLYFSLSDHYETTQEPYAGGDRTDGYTGVVITPVGKVTLTPFFYYAGETCQYFLDDESHNMTGTWAYKDTDGVDYYKFTTPVTFTVEETGLELTMPIGLIAFPQNTKLFTLDILPTDYTFGGKYSIYGNLPDMTIIEFIKAIMYCEGVFAFADPKSADAIGFESVDAFLVNKQAAVDWTNKLVNEMPAFKKPAYSEYNFNSLAKKNRLLWTNDDDDDKDTPDFSGYLYTANQTIDNKKDLLSIPTFQGTTEKNGFAYIELYAKDFSVNSVTPRLLTIDVKDGIAYGRFAEPNYNLSFSASDGIIARKYKGYSSLIAKPRYLKVNCVLTDLDLFNLQMDTPVYFEQYGHYYGIIKLQVKSNNLCACEFLRIPTETASTALTAAWLNYVCEKTSMGQSTNLITVSLPVNPDNPTHNFVIKSTAQYAVTHDVYVVIKYHTVNVYGDITYYTYIQKIPAGATSKSTDFYTDMDHGLSILDPSIIDVAITSDGNTSNMEMSGGDPGWQTAAFTGLTGTDTDDTYQYIISATPVNSGYKRFISLSVSDGSIYYLCDAFNSYAAITAAQLAVLSKTDYNTRLNDFCDMLEADNAGLTIDRTGARVLNTTDCPI